MGVDKATSVSDTNMAQSQHQYYVYAPSFSASHRVIDPPPHSPPPPPCPPPLLHPCLSSACTRPLRAAALDNKAPLWPDGAVFLLLHSDWLSGAFKSFSCYDEEVGGVGGCRCGV